MEDLLYQGEIRIRQEKVIQFWFVQFRGEFFYCAEALLNYFFILCYCSYGKLVHRRDIYHGGENFRKTCIF